MRECELQRKRERENRGMCNTRFVRICSPYNIAMGVHKKGTPLEHANVIIKILLSVLYCSIIILCGMYCYGHKKEKFGKFQENERKNNIIVSL